MGISNSQENGTKSDEVQNAGVYLSAQDISGESQATVSVETDQRLYYIHNVEGKDGDERNIKGNDVDWNIKMVYTKVRPFLTSDELIRYVPYGLLLEHEYDEAVKILYTQGTITTGEGADAETKTVYNLKNDWKSILEDRKNEDVKKARSWLYSRGYYILQIIDHESIKTNLLYTEGWIEQGQFVTPTASGYYIYDPAKDEYKAQQLTGPEKKEKLDQVTVAMRFPTKYEPSQKIEGITPRKKKEK
ncbi:hypothetical protein K7I13_11055 [Brucepastera parasyntrophica]|uniref:hypothetical protein n=1 Tax=Brucepastera parasyntrophica TaxID=2880008 RepID=UPI00210DBDD3|nr:hypothetical protein [Brucepastera parasyntrophica]ULQ59046.1 hypothetical protein K7I13_11055 [Brucepastera parasyntrophica]